MIHEQTGQFSHFKVFPKTYRQLMEYLYPQMGKVTLQCSQGSCTLWTQSGHEVTLHLHRGCDFHNILRCFFSGLKCVWTVQMVRKICTLKKLPLVLTTIMHVLRDTEPSWKTYLYSVCLYSSFCFSFSKLVMLWLQVFHTWTTVRCFYYSAWHVGIVYKLLCKSLRFFKFLLSVTNTKYFFFNLAFYNKCTQCILFS